MRKFSFFKNTISKNNPTATANMTVGLPVSWILLFRLDAQAGGIVKQVSGNPVVNHINRLLANEAVLLLRHSSMSVAQIAERLNFAETTTFARFFKRMKGKNPLEYRKSL